MNNEQEKDLNIKKIIAIGIFAIVFISYFILVLIRNGLAVSYICTEANQTVICPNCLCECTQPNITIPNITVDVSYPNQTFDFPMNISYLANASYCKDIMDRIENSTSGVVGLGENYADCVASSQFCENELAKIRNEEMDLTKCKNNLDVCESNLKRCEDKILTKGYTTWADVPAKSAYDSELQKKLLYGIGIGGVGVFMWFRSKQKPIAESRTDRE